jgi:formylglycine-generating enzyme required for sulfatase activity
MRSVTRLGLPLAGAILSGTVQMALADPASLPAVPEIKLVDIPAGSFAMGGDGNFDEAPVHTVTISRPFKMAATDVTNTQYEAFDPGHKKLRGKDGISTGDDEAVVFVSHDDAVAFCKWMTEKTGKPYRLPTEAEWEYACRAGTTTAYNTGPFLPEADQINQKAEWGPKPASLKVGERKPNAWGLFDMHGLVEQWCADWYGPYEAGDQTDPVGRKSGLFRVTRGGSFNTPVVHLRSAARFGTVPADSSWLIGFRVVLADAPTTLPMPPVRTPRWGRDVSTEKFDYPAPADQSPRFDKPIPYVNIAPASNGPMYSRHNHCPGIAACPNGDLLVTFYTCNEESGREMAVAATRLRRGSDHFDPDEIFYKAPGRNMHATALWWDGKNTLYHFQGIGIGDGWQSLALMVRTSDDSGATWSDPTWISREHQLRNMPIAGVIGTSDGKIVVPCDAVTGGDGGSAVHVSSDAGKTWTDPGAGTVPLRPKYSDPGVHGGSIAGIHAKLVELNDHRWMAFGRGDSIDGRMPMSITADAGKTWAYAPTVFPPITSGQRMVLMRLKEGPLLLVSFANDPGMEFTDPTGNKFVGHGMYAALSTDDGRTWPVRKLLTPGEGTFDGQGWTGVFKTDTTHAEPKGYLAATQTPDGWIHLVSSGLYYRLNLAWLRS